MTTRRVTTLAALIALLAQPAAARDGVESARERASRLRAQPAQASQQGQQPAWFVERADNSSLRLSVLSQTRYVYNTRESNFVPGSNRQTYGFSQPRTRLALEGNIVSSQFNYRISFDFGDAELSRGRGAGQALPGSTGTPRLLDAYAQYNFTGKREGYYLKFGQFQSIVMTEEAVDSGMQQGVDRSLSSELFGPGYTQGIALGRVLKDYAWEVSVNDGGRFIGQREPENTAFNDPIEGDLGVSGRFDWKIEGDWEQFADFTSWRGSNEGSKLGAGFVYQFTGQTNPSEFTPPFLAAPAESGQYVTWTVDYQHEFDGWNIFAAYTGMYVDFEFAAGTLAAQHNSLLVQGGWFISDQTEWFARFEAFWIDKAFRNGFGLQEGFIHRLYTVGFNHYFLPESHALKFSADVTYTRDSLNVLSVGADSIGLPDPSTTNLLGLSEEEFVVRLQLQLMF